jgi:hypothetical protein
MPDLTASFTLANFNAIVAWINAQRGSTGNPLYTSTNAGWTDLVSKGPLNLALTSAYAPSNVIAAQASAAAANAYLQAALNPMINGFIGFSLSALGLSVAAGSSGTTTLTVAYLGDFTGTIALTSMCPSSTLTVTVAGGTPNGTFNVAIIGTSGAVVNQMVFALTITGGSSSGTYTNGPFTATNPGAMTVGTAYSLTMTYTLPTSVTLAGINWWSVWCVLPASAPNNASGYPPPAGSPAIDVQPSNVTGQVIAWQADGIHTVAFTLGVSSTAGSSLWELPMISATIAAASGVVTLTLPNVVFEAAGAYHLYMRVNYQNPAGGGSLDQLDGSGNIWFDLGSYHAS